MGQPKVSKIEIAKQLPSAADVEAWAAAANAETSRSARAARPCPQRVRERPRPLHRTRPAWIAPKTPSAPA